MNAKTILDYSPSEIFYSEDKNGFIYLEISQTLHENGRVSNYINDKVLIDMEKVEEQGYLTNLIRDFSNKHAVKRISSALLEIAKAADPEFSLN